MELLACDNLSQTRAAKTSQPLLASTAIDYFAFIRVFNTRQFSFLSSHPNVLNCFQQEGLLNNTWVSNYSSDSKKTGMSLWCVSHKFNEDAQDFIGSLLSNEFALQEGIDIFNHNSNGLDVYCFAANNKSIYNVPLSTLYQFIYYFHQEMIDVLNNFSPQTVSTLTHRTNEILVETNQMVIPTFEVATAHQYSNHQLFDIDRYHFDISKKGSYLTKREFYCAMELVNGSTVKKMAYNLQCSPRTIENHIHHIKLKLNVHFQSDLIEKLKSGLF